MTDQSGDVAGLVKSDTKRVKVESVDRSVNVLILPYFYFIFLEPHVA